MLNGLENFSLPRNGLFSVIPILFKYQKLMSLPYSKAAVWRGDFPVIPLCNLGKERNNKYKICLF